MYVLGFSINLLTLFGLVLGHGIVVGRRHRGTGERSSAIMRTLRRRPRVAAIQAMNEVWARWSPSCCRCARCSSGVVPGGLAV